MFNKKLIIYLFSIILIGFSAFLVYKTFYSRPLNQNTTPTTQDIPSPTASPTTPTSSTNTKNNLRNQPTITTHTPTPDPQTYGCDPVGNCNSYLNPKEADCPLTFKTDTCNNQCSNPSLRCKF